MSIVQKKGGKVTHAPGSRNFNLWQILHYYYADSFRICHKFMSFQNINYLHWICASKKIKNLFIFSKHVIIFRPEINFTIFIHKRKRKKKPKSINILYIYKYVQILKIWAKKMLPIQLFFNHYNLYSQRKHLNLILFGFTFKKQEIG